MEIVTGIWKESTFNVEEFGNEKGRKRHVLIETGCPKISGVQ